MRLLVLAVLLSGCASDRGFNWAIQGQDGAIEGCPGQYHQYADQFLIGCWGKK
jgi:uncharacterized protein YceK